MAELLGVLVSVAKHIWRIAVEEVALGIVLLDDLIVQSIKNFLLNR